MIGKTIDGRYRILGTLGRGGMGAVYEAEHTGTGRRVAVKIIHADLAQKSEPVRRFQREARAAGSIETPHIVHVFDTGTDAQTGVVYMAMELLRGEDLQHLIKRLGPLPPDVALRLAGQACAGLVKAHEARVIHRDIKPANLFIAKDEAGDVTVKVVDFGIAKIKPDPASSQETGLTATGGLIGSPRYMSPEQAMGKKTVDHRTDVWSLGVVLYEALAGRGPHASCETVGELIFAICSEPAPPLQDSAPWVPAAIAELVHRAVAIPPGDRFADISAMLEAIQAAAGESCSVHADDLVSLTTEQRDQTAPRAALPSSTTSRNERWGPERSSPPESVGLSVSQSASAARPLARVYWGISALAAVAGTGIVAYKVAGRDRADTSGGGLVSTAAAPSTLGVSGPAPADTPAVTPREQIVRLAVEPADATVEVDGQALAVNDGGVDLRGAVGSVHRVRLRKGRIETSSDVAVTASGALPPGVKLDLPPSRAPAPSPPSPSPGAIKAKPTEMGPSREFK